MSIHGNSLNRNNNYQNHNQHINNQNVRRSGASSPPLLGQNSLRSQSLGHGHSLRSAHNSTLLRDSMIIEPIPDNIMPSDSLERKKNIDFNIPESGQIQQTTAKISTNLIPTFVLETISLLCMASLAYILRFTNSFPVLVRGFYCDDDDIAYPHDPAFGRNSTPLFKYGKHHAVYYSVTIGFPVAVILICEISRNLIIGKRKRKIIAQTACITCKVHLLTRRIFRFLGGYFFGLFITSIFTDSLKLLTGRLRPYFLDLCQPFECTITNITESNIYSQILLKRHIWVPPYQPSLNETFCTMNKDHDTLRFARMSFPSSSSSITTYCGIFIIFYITRVITLRSALMIRTMVSAAILLAISIVCSSRIIFHENHLGDVIASLIIGIIFAFYICIIQLKCFNDNDCDSPEVNGQMDIDDSINDMNHHDHEDSWYWKYFHIPRVNLLRRSARYFNRKGANVYEPNDNRNQIVRQNGNGPTAAYVNPAFDQKEYDNHTVDGNNIDRRSLAFQDQYRH